jgi:hypothetical protein
MEVTKSDNDLLTVVAGQIQVLDPAFQWYFSLLRLSRKIREIAQGMDVSRISVNVHKVLDSNLYQRE